MLSGAPLVGENYDYPDEVKTYGNPTTVIPQIVVFNGEREETLVSGDEVLLQPLDVDLNDINVSYTSSTNSITAAINTPFSDADGFETILYINGNNEVSSYDSGDYTISKRNLSEKVTYCMSSFI